MKKQNTHNSTLDRFDGNLWHFHFKVPATVANLYIDKNSKRVICKLNNLLDFQCALMPDGNGNYFINVNKSIRDKLGLKQGDSLHYALQKDESEFGLPVPPELEELFLVDPEGKEIFDSLTPGKKRTLLYIAASPKNSDIRLKKSLCIINHLKYTSGKINYKQLNEMIKNA